MSATDEGLHGHDYDDLAPGDEPPAEGLGAAVRGYVLGFILATALTAASFYVATHNVVWEPSAPAALVTLAIAQMGIHLVFFLHITTGPDNTNNVLALGFGVLTVGLILGGSVWIMDHLNTHMMTLQSLPAAGGAEMSMKP